MKVSDVTAFSKVVLAREIERDRLDCEQRWWGGVVEIYFVKVVAMPRKHGSGKWNYDIFAISLQLPRQEA
jgi:hypothetical protein